MDFSEALILLIITGSAVKPGACCAAEADHLPIMALGLRGYGVLGPLAAAAGR